MSMKTLVHGKVGPYRSAAGVETPIRVGIDSELIVGQSHGTYFEPTFRNGCWSAANQAAQAVSVALATTYTGILLFNPVGSGKVLVPGRVSWALSVAPVATATIGLIEGFSATGGVTAQTTPLTNQSCNIGNSSRGVGVALSSATIVTPTWLFQLQNGFTAGSLPAPTAVFDFNGVFTLQPGSFIAIGALTAVTGLGSITWEELSTASL